MACCITKYLSFLTGASCKNFEIYFDRITHSPRSLSLGQHQALPHEMFRKHRRIPWTCPALQRGCRLLLCNAQYESSTSAVACLANIAVQSIQESKSWTTSQRSRGNPLCSLEMDPPGGNGVDARLPLWKSRVPIWACGREAHSAAPFASPCRIINAKMKPSQPSATLVSLMGCTKYCNRHCFDETKSDIANIGQPHVPHEVLQRPCSALSMQPHGCCMGHT